MSSLPDKDDAFNLRRFVDAQEGIYRGALAELRHGAKHGHWMWFVFPQIAGLGRSETARAYAIGSIEEARAYLDHPVLGARYRESVEVLQSLPPTGAAEVFGGIDAMKLRSSLTLFAGAGSDPLFLAALDRWFGGEKDEKTMALLGRE